MNEHSSEWHLGVCTWCSKPDMVALLTLSDSDEKDFCHGCMYVIKRQCEVRMQELDKGN
jgi:hypothetical protein